MASAAARICTPHFLGNASTAAQGTFCGARGVWGVPQGVPRKAVWVGARRPRMPHRTGACMCRPQAAAPKRAGSAGGTSTAASAAVRGRRQQRRASERRHAGRQRASPPPPPPPPPHLHQQAGAQHADHARQAQLPGDERADLPAVWSRAVRRQGRVGKVVQAATCKHEHADLNGRVPRQAGRCGAGCARAGAPSRVHARAGRPGRGSQRLEGAAALAGARAAARPGPKPGRRQTPPAAALPPAASRPACPAGGPHLGGGPQQQRGPGGVAGQEGGAHGEVEDCGGTGGRHGTNHQ